MSDKHTSMTALEIAEEICSRIDDDEGEYTHDLSIPAVEAIIAKELTRVRREALEEAAKVVAFEADTWRKLSEDARRWGRDHAHFDMAAESHEDVLEAVRTLIDKPGEG